MAVNSETEINLKTLQRVDSNIIEIIDNASQVAIYKFERKMNKWEGTDIEGTLFLYRRSLYPFHGFIIVNRMSTTNFVEDITSDMEFLLQEPYFLYKKSCGDIIGSWFYEEKDFRRITNKIQSIVLKQVSPPKRQRCSSDGDSSLKKDEVVQDIMSMLSEAHTEYVRNEVKCVLPERNIEENFSDLSAYLDREINNKSLHKNRNEVKCIVPERNIEENFNDLSAYLEKEINNKSLHKNVKKSKSPLRSSSEEKYPVSPRRRFLSTGSFDPTHSMPLTSNKILNELVNCSKEAAARRTVKVCHVNNKTHLMDSIPGFPENILAPSKLSPVFCQEKPTNVTGSDVNILNKMVKPSEISVNPPIMSPNIPLNTSSDCVLKKNDDFDYADHSSSLKEALIAHLECNSNIVLKIHEAYVASLKSIFTAKKS